MIDLSKLTPAELIRQAVKDVRASLKQGIKINMSYWIKGNGVEENSITDPYHKVCSVCFAGAVMMQNKDMSVLKEVSNISYFSVNYSKFTKEYDALDSIRSGNILLFFEYLGYKNEKVKTYTKSKIVLKETIRLTYDLPLFKRYDSDNPEEFLTQMEDIADLVEEITPQFTKIK